MSNKTRSILKVIALLLVILAVLMEMSFISIPMLNTSKFWMVVIGFCMVIIAGK